jgi:hypothetical protein
MPPCGEPPRDPRRATAGSGRDGGRAAGCSRDANCGIFAASLAVAGTEVCAGMGSTTNGISNAVSPTRRIVRNTQVGCCAWLGIGWRSLAVGVAEIFFLVPKAGRSYTRLACPRHRKTIPNRNHFRRRAISSSAMQKNPIFVAILQCLRSWPKLPGSFLKERPACSSEQASM